MLPINKKEGWRGRDILSFEERIGASGHGEVQRLQTLEVLQCFIYVVGVYPYFFVIINRSLSPFPPPLKNDWTL